MTFWRSSKSPCSPKTHDESLKKRQAERMHQRVTPNSADGWSRLTLTVGTEKSAKNFGRRSRLAEWQEEEQALLASLRELEHAENPERTLDRVRILELANKAHSVRDQRPDQQEEPGAERQDSGIVQTLGFVIARFIHESRDRDEQSDADRQVDEEGPTPPEETRDDAADDWAAGDRNADQGAPERIGFCPLLLCERMIDDRERRCQQQARTNALQRPRKVQHQGGLRQAAETGRHREEHEANQRRALAPMPVGIGAGREQQRRETQHVRADHPFDVGEAGAERARERRRTPGDDIRLEQSQRRHQRRRNENAAPHCRVEARVASFSD